MVRRLVLCMFAVLVLTLLIAGAVSAATYTPTECVTCHTSLTPGIVTQFQNGVMSQNGVTCVSCHGDDHSAIFAGEGKVPAGTCATCHAAEYGEFAHKDAAGNYTNKHAIGWSRMVAAARYKVMPDPERYEMCERCHDIGYVSADGSVGKCDSCHTRHTFSADEAMEPEACGTCHMGPDHEQIDMWEKSKHGVVYTTEKDRPNGHPDRAPTCVTCHMPVQENGASKPLVHDVSTNITIGTVAQGARLVGAPQPVPMRAITQDEFTAKRAKMTSICGQCHAAGFVEKNLEGADQIKADVDTLLWDPVMRVRGLWYDGLLDPMPVDRAPNPLFGPNLVLGGQQLYGGTSAVEQLFFNTYKYDHVNTFKGAYHLNPDYSHWFGWARVNVDRDLVKGEEAKLRRLEKPYDPGFTVKNLVAGQRARFDASRLLGWGDASPNTFAWWFGDGSSEGTATATAGVAKTTHVDAKPGTYKVQLTCADSDLMNDAAQPLKCSALRTTTLKVKVVKK
jgi:hydroxylamine dehydrogenase